MSKRSDAAKARGLARRQEQDGAEPPARGGRFARFRRWRVTIVATTLILVVALASLVSGLQPPRLTLINKTGAPIADLRVDFPGGTAVGPPVENGETVTLSLRAGPAPAADAGLTLQFRRPDGTTFKLRSRSLGKGRGTHEVFTAVGLPDGTIQVVKNEGPAVGGGGLRGMFRRLGWNF